MLAIRRDGAVIDVDVHVECSTGTYVRALARDLGSALGRRRPPDRTAPHAGRPLCAGRSAHARRLSPTTWSSLPIAEAAREAFPARDVDAAEAVVVSHGGPLPASGTDGPVAVFGPDGTFLALLEDRGDHEGARGLRLTGLARTRLSGQSVSIICT